MLTWHGPSTNSCPPRIKLAQYNTLKLRSVRLKFWQNYFLNCQKHINIDLQLGITHRFECFRERH